MTTTIHYKDARYNARQKMPQATHDLAEYALDLHQRAARGLVLMDYDLGLRLADALDRVRVYGDDAVKLVAKYVNIPGGETRLYALANFARTFDRDFVSREIKIPMDNGRYLETGHFTALAGLWSPETQATMLIERIRRESLTVRQAEQLATEMW